MATVIKVLLFLVSNMDKLKIIWEILKDFGELWGETTEDNRAKLKETASHDCGTRCRTLKHAAKLAPKE